VRLLAQAFLKRYGKARVRGMDDEAMTILERYQWPGNVRELQNVIERACALADGDTIVTRDLPRQIVDGETPASPSPGGSPTALPPGTDLPLMAAKERWMAVLEATYLREVLARHGGNISAAAKAAGIDRKTFHRLINKHNLR
jgi:DNA-binding NtrC family response regulator